MKMFPPNDPVTSQEVMLSEGIANFPSTLVPGEAPLRSPDLTLVQLLKILRRRILLILTTVFVCLLLGMLFCIVSSKKYTATASILVQNGSADGIDKSALMGSNPAPPDSIEADITVQTQAKILQSNTLAFRTIRKLDLEHKYEFLHSGGFVSQILDLLNRIGKTPDRNQGAGAAAIEATLLKRFQTNLTVKPILGTRLISISFVSPNAQLSADVVNELVRELVEYTFETRYKATQAATQSLTTQLADLRAKSEALQAKVAAMQEDSGIYSIGTTDAQGRQQAYSAILDQFQRSAVTLNQAAENRALKEAIYDAAKDGNAELISSLGGNSVGGASGAGMTNSLTTIQQLRGQEATLQGQLDQLRVKFGSGYPKLAELEGTIDSLHRAIQQEVDRIAGRAKNDFVVADQTYKSAKQTYDKQRTEADALNTKTIKYMIARQEADESRTLYEDLLKRQKEVGILQSLKSDTITVVDDAIPAQTPTTPNVPLILAAALALGVLGGCIAALISELFDDTLHDEAAIYQMGMPFLGTLPNSRSQQFGLEVVNHPESAYSDAVRDLRSSLIRPRTGDPAKVVLITSAVPNRAKALLSANLAASAAQVGKKVLLVEADMRNPNVRNIIGFSGGIGLTELLLGDISSETVAHPLSTLYVLPSDSDHKNGYQSALVDSDQLHRLMMEWRESFDLVIVDSPSILSLADSRYLSEMSDVTIEVAERGVTTVSSLKRAYRLLRSHANGKLFVVLSGVTEHSKAHSQYYGEQGLNRIAKGNLV